MLALVGVASGALLSTGPADGGVPQAPNPVETRAAVAVVASAGVQGPLHAAPALLSTTGAAVPTDHPVPAANAGSAASAGGSAVLGPAVGEQPDASMSGPVLLEPPVTDAAVTSPFGYRIDPLGGDAPEFHAGLDYGSSCGTGVVAAGTGQVTEAGWHAYGGGYRITVDHGAGLQTTYNHLSVLEASVGAPVQPGTLLGMVGSTGNSTGCHLHFEVMVDARKVDPLPWLRSSG